jgi:hypothetical protein
MVGAPEVEIHAHVPRKTANVLLGRRLAQFSHRHSAAVWFWFWFCPFIVIAFLRWLELREEGRVAEQEDGEEG